MTPFGDTQPHFRHYEWLEVAIIAEPSRSDAF